MNSERMNESCDSKVGVTGRLLKAEYKRLSLEQEQARLLDSQLRPISACLSHLNDLLPVSQSDSMKHAVQRACRMSIIPTQDNWLASSG